MSEFRKLFGPNQFVADAAQSAEQVDIGRGRERWCLRTQAGLAERYFSDRDPMGQHIGFASDPANQDMEIVGIARDAKYGSLRDEIPATVYRPFAQESEIPRLYFELRRATDPLALVSAARAAVAPVDRNVPLFGIETETQQIVLRMVPRETLLLVLSGVVIGILGSFTATRFASSVISDLQFGFKASDVSTIVLATIVLMVVAVFAGFLPARRAMRVDPMVALRHE